MPETKDLFALLNSSQNILILLNKELSILDVQSIHSLVIVIESLNKSFQIVNLTPLDDICLKYAQGLGIDIFEKLKPSEYSISIDYGSSGIEKVVYDIDKENGKLVFKIIPTKTGFSFDKVQFTEGNGTFDGTISIGIDDPKSLKEFYDENEYLFKENNLFKFNTVSDVNQYLIDNGSNLDQKVVDKLTEEFINSTNILEGELTIESQSSLAKLLDQRGNISKSIQKKYYSKSKTYLEIVKQALQNMVTVDKVSYAIVDKSDLKLSDLTTFGRIPFNVVEGVDISFLFIQVVEGLGLIVESNVDNYNAGTIAGVFGGTGDNAHAFCLLDGIMINELEKRFWPIIKDLYNVDVVGVKGIPTVDNSSKVLTKSRRNSKNKGLQNIK